MRIHGNNFLWGIVLFLCFAIGGLYLTNSLANPGLQQVPFDKPDLTNIPAGGFLVIGNKTGIGIDSVNLEFGLNHEGGEIGLSQWTAQGFEFIDSVRFAYQGMNISTGRARDGLNAWTQFSIPTPGLTNYNNTTAIELSPENPFKVYPNPVASDILYFTGLRDVSLINQLGVCVKQANNTRSLRLNGLTPGIYFLKTSRGEIRRVIIQSTPASPW